MKQHSSSLYYFLIISCLLAIGISIGWLVGLSISPVASIVITSVTGSAAAIVAALSGLERKTDNGTSDSKVSKRSWSLDPIPLTSLTLGILIGSVMGIYARNYHLLGSDISGEISKWSDEGIDKQLVANRLFDAKYPYPPLTEIYTPTLLSEIEFWTTVGVPREEVARQLLTSRYLVTKATFDQLLGTKVATVDSSLLGTTLFATDTDECVSLVAAAEMARALSDGQILVRALESSTNNGLRQLSTIISDTEILQEIVEKVLCTED